MIRVALLLAALTLVPAFTAPWTQEEPGAADGAPAAVMKVIGRARPTGGTADPILLDAANGETFLLVGLEAGHVESLRAATSPVAVSGAFRWSRHDRLLEVASVTAATEEQFAAARSVEPQYEMSGFVMTILRTGKPDAEFGAEEKKKLFEGHFAHINEQAAAGKLVIAGPFGAPVSETGEKLPSRYRGIYIYRSDSVAEVRELNAKDPTVKSGYFEADVVPWYGPASLGY